MRRNDIESPGIESIWVEIKLKNSKSFLICSLYRPPSSNTDWYDKFSGQIEKSLSICDEIYIMGDLNFDYKNGNFSCQKWKHVIELNDLHQVINKPTRITAHSETAIDHVYVTTPENIADIFVPSIAVSNHFPTCFIRTTAKNTIKRHNHKCIQYRPYSNFNEDIFLEELSENMLSPQVSQTDPNLNFETWTGEFLKVFSKHAPLKSKRVKRETQPEWLNDDIKYARKNRDKYHKMKDWKQYKHWRNKTSSLIRSSKMIFFQGQ